MKTAGPEFARKLQASRARTLEQQSRICAGTEQETCR